MTPVHVGILLADHLWQTTFVLLAACLAVWLAGPARPALRSGIWFGAALKCATPFSAIGWLLSDGRVPATGAASVTSFVQTASQPFAMQAAPIVLGAATGDPSHLVGWLALTVWLAGAVSLIAADVFAAIRLRRGLVATRRATSGREYDALARVAHGPARAPVTLRLSSTHVEPGVLGTRRPMLVWPTAITPLLSDVQLAGVFSHELAHVRRRDNLRAHLQRIAQALLWFYPPVWWIGRQMLAERERACDQEVLRGGTDQHAYAEALLTICRVCVLAPRPVAGVLGSRLRLRVEDIMRFSEPAPLAGRTVLALLLTAMGVVAAPIATNAFDTPVILTSSAPPDSPASSRATRRDEHLNPLRRRLDGTRVTLPPLPEPQADIPRSLVASPDTPARSDSLCLDDHQREHSPGAIVPIRREAPGRARCIDGRWLEVDSRYHPIGIGGR